MSVSSTLPNVKTDCQKSYFLILAAPISFIECRTRPVITEVVDSFYHRHFIIKALIVNVDFKKLVDEHIKDNAVWLHMYST